MNHAQSRNNFQIYLSTRTSNAVVCGGILAVIIWEWRTRTKSPGTSCPNSMGRPKALKILAFLARLKRMTEETLRSLTVVKLLERLSMSTILPSVTMSGEGCGCGGRGGRGGGPGGRGGSQLQLLLKLSIKLLYFFLFLLYELGGREVQVEFCHIY